MITTVPDQQFLTQGVPQLIKPEEKDRRAVINVEYTTHQRETVGM
jgi:hypothetical protein